MSTIPLSVLDQSPIPEGSDGGVALRNTIDLAQCAEDLGYTRYWIAEHHATPGLASASPEVMIGPVALATKKIRVGSGGVMLPHYSPLKVAETFTMLSALTPGRIDLGVGRAPGSDQQTALALQRDRRQRSPDDFPDQLDELLAYFDGDREKLPIRRALPGLPHVPKVWLLGSSPASGAWAANFGLPYVFADFIAGPNPQIARYYRQNFKPGCHQETPRVTAAVWAIAADTDEEARRLASSFQMMMTLLYRGQLIAVPPVEKALAFLEAEGIAPGQLPPGRRAVIGSPETVKAGLEAVAEEYQADELMLVNILFDHAARRRSYELIAGAFGLQ